MKRLYLATALTALPQGDPANPLASLDYSWFEAFIGTIPGSMGETSVLACLFGAALGPRVAAWLARKRAERRLALAMAVLGLVASAVMLGLGMAYLERERRAALARGEGFVTEPWGQTELHVSGTFTTAESRKSLLDSLAEDRPNPFYEPSFTSSTK